MADLLENPRNRAILFVELPLHQNSTPIVRGSDMPTAVVSFLYMLANTQSQNRDAEHMLSQVFFDLTVDGQQFPFLHVDVKQPIGVSFENAPLEVSRPVDYNGSIDQQALSRAVESYYRKTVSSRSRAYRISPLALRSLVTHYNVIERARVTFDFI